MSAIQTIFGICFQYIKDNLYWEILLLRCIDRYGILKRILAHEVNGTQAADLLQLSVRHIRRLKVRVREGGAQGLIHRRRGKPGNRRLPEKERTHIASLISKRYADFGPTFATEKLRECHRVKRDVKTIRNVMITMGLWQGRKRRIPVAHHWRARKEHPGELVQFDGSYEFWFEDRGERTCLLAAIDDATGKILHAQFALHEGVFPVFGFWKSYLERVGKPRAIYLDKFSTYKQNLDTADPDSKTQFGRALQELGIAPIFANSPQAKGRVERLFKTLQDRLIRELRLQNISSSEKANCFLKESFIPDFNCRFAVQPVSSIDLHRSLSAHERATLATVFSRQEERSVRNDYTVSFKNAWYQILPTPRVVVRPKDSIRIEERLDGSLHMRIRNAYLNFKKLPLRALRQDAPWVLAKLPEKAGVSWKPAADHPWKRLPLNFSAAR